MRDLTLLLHDVRCTPASEHDVESGLLAFVSFRVGDFLFVDGVTVRRTLNGRIALSWPCRTDSAGRRHPILRPADDAARQQLERAVIHAIAENLPRRLP